jgi:hypothetical protein
VFVKVGAWKSFDELEENVSLVELDWMLKAIRQDQEDTESSKRLFKGLTLMPQG